jgi:hypothetical protein
MVSTSAGENAALLGVTPEAKPRSFILRVRPGPMRMNNFRENFALPHLVRGGMARRRLMAVPEILVSWQIFEADLERLLEILREPAFLIGHSIGETVSLMLRPGGQIWRSASS